MDADKFRWKREYLVSNNEPILVPVGAADMGKTMAIVTLLRYIVEKGGSVEVLKDASNMKSSDYYELAQEYHDYIHGINRTPKRNPKGESYLFRVNAKLNRSEMTFKVVDSAGESYFDEEDPNSKSRLFVSDIFRAEVPKIYAIFFRLDAFGDLPVDEQRRNRLLYGKRQFEILLQYFKPEVDKIILVTPRVDEIHGLRNVNNIEDQTKIAKEMMFSNGFYENFKNSVNAETQIFKREIPNITYSAGEFEDNEFAPGDSRYPANFLQTFYEAYFDVNRKKNFFSKYFQLR